MLLYLSSVALGFPEAVYCSKCAYIGCTGSYNALRSVMVGSTVPAPAYMGSNVGQEQAVPKSINYGRLMGYVSGVVNWAFTEFQKLIILVLVVSYVA